MRICGALETALDRVSICLPSYANILCVMQDNCKSCSNFVNAEGNCPVCPLKFKLNQPLAPMISSKSEHVMYTNGEYTWMESHSQTATVLIFHSQVREIRRVPPFHSAVDSRHMAFEQAQSFLSAALRNACSFDPQSHITFCRWMGGKKPVPRPCSRRVTGRNRALSTTTSRGRRLWSSASTTPSGESLKFLETSYCLPAPRGVRGVPGPRVKLAEPHVECAWSWPALHGWGLCYTTHNIFVSRRFVAAMTTHSTIIIINKTRVIRRFVLLEVMAVITARGSKCCRRFTHQSHVSGRLVCAKYFPSILGDSRLVQPLNVLGTSLLSRRVEVRGVHAASECAGTLHTRFLNSVKAVAIHERAGQSVTVKEDFKKYAPTGVGMRLEKVNGLQGVYVIELVRGGSAWRANEIRVGDEIRMIDNMELGDMELTEITRCIQGQAGTKVRLNGRRRGTRGKRSQRCCLVIHYTHARVHTHTDSPEHPARGSRRAWKCRGWGGLPLLVDNHPCSCRRFS